MATWLWNLESQSNRLEFYLFNNLEHVNTTQIHSVRYIQLGCILKVAVVHCIAQSPVLDVHKRPVGFRAKCEIFCFWLEEKKRE